ncbi:MAG: TolC family protein [Flavobacteriaceae bacterium]|nr:TolC family protein [Flavobacteriaceae bacterium]
MKYKIIAILLLFFSLFESNAQQSITLQQCYDWAKQNHPLQEKSQILSTQSDWEIQALDAQKLPKIDLEAQATYQSDVMVLPISLPNISIESPDKDQYKATLTVSQLIYNGDVIDTQKELKKKLLEAQQKEIEVQLHPLKWQINQLFFGILLLQQKMEILQKNIEQLHNKKIEIEKLIATGSTYESAVEPIQVKILELTQNIVELNAQKLQQFDQLSLILGQKIQANASLNIPEVISPSTLPRSELELFELQKATTDLQKDLLQKQTLPKIMAFGTGGYGKPGLNMLDNSFAEYYMAGVKIQWNVYDFQANKKQRTAIALNKDLIDNQKKVFEWNQNNAVQNYQSEIVKYHTLFQTDQEIIQYRQKIVETAAKQLKHDLITTSDYTAEINKLLEAEINQKTHQILLALAQSNYNTTLYE